MSLHSFKEALKPCRNSSSLTSSTIQSQSSLTQTLEDPTIPRKPPKSSLSQQLLRLQDPLSLPPIQPQSQPKQTHDQNGMEDENDEKDDDPESLDYEKPKVGLFEFDRIGPYEPLVLSSEGEFPVIQVPASINCRLLEHQREGVKFLYNLYKNNHGGILGDDMGLGKTIQTIAFLAAVFGNDGDCMDSTLLKKNQTAERGPVLIVCPSSVIHNWESEFSKWANFSVAVYHGANRDLVYDKLEAHEVEILITSFDTYRICGSQLSEVNWEIVIVDEAHRLKNEKSKLYIACLEFKTLKRIGLTGTVMQNKIMELFNLFDWVAPGSLGTREHFREFYDEPLKHGQRSTAPERFVRVADERKQHLVALLHKYMLRRTKEETIGHLMMGKEDNVIFCAMSELQKRVYRRMLQLPDIQCLINKDLPCSCGSPLTQAECCKRTVPDGKIWPYLHKENPDGCDSCPFCIVLPCLIKLQQISNHLELIKPNPKDDPDKQKKDAEFATAVFGTDINLVGGNTQNESFMGLSDVKHCGKMRALEKFLFSWISCGDKVLLFSYSVRMLDILEKFLIRKGYCFSRLDGSTPTNLRQSIVDDFNSSPSKQVFLISTRAGGLGLNLVSANRVVIFDPSWNPAQDLQAQDRSFRFGQKRHVVVFRFLSAGSLDELVYSRQVYKQQLSNIAVSGKMEKRYFEGVQDCKEFQGELFGICNLFRDLSDKVFTSEIFELHEKDGQIEGYGIRQQSTDVGSNSVSLKEVGVTSLSLSETRTTSNSKKGLTSQPVLKDVGVVYAHRNEDILNYGPGGQGAIEMIPQNNGIMDPYIRVARRKRLDGIVGKENFPSCKDQKRIQYSLLSMFMGLGELEFSKWVISASPMEREDNYWLGFCTVMDFFWVDQYDVMSGPNRKVRRLMEEDNKKLRKKAKREYNDTVRGLAEFVKKRDKRVMDMMVKREEERERKREEEREKKKKLEKEKLERAMAYEEPEWAKVVEEEEGGNEVEEMEEEEEERRRKELYCVVCGKKFKSEKQWKNHEQSKKHRDKVAEFRESIGDEEFDAREILEGEVEERGEVDDIDGVDTDELGEGIREGLKIGEEENGVGVSDREDKFYEVGDENEREKVDEAVGLDGDDGEDEMGVLEAMLAGRNSRKNAALRVEQEDSFVTDIHAENDDNEVEFMEYDNRKSTRRKGGARKDRSKKSSGETKKVGRSEINSDRGEELNEHDNSHIEESASHSFVKKESNDKGDDQLARKKKSSSQPVDKKENVKKEANSKSKNSSKGKKAKAASKNSSNLCDTCGEEFDSRNKLHKHLGDTGHAKLK